MSFESLLATFIPNHPAQTIAITFHAIFHISFACCSCGNFSILFISLCNASHTLFNIQIAHSFLQNSYIKLACSFISSLYSQLKLYFHINIARSAAQVIIIFHHSYIQTTSHFNEYKAFCKFCGACVISFIVILLSQVDSSFNVKIFCKFFVIA
ncbi:MAG: hypothetical protein LBU14_05500 [Candidatus Peribacteria bacterium]|nr:hypothetical protein [Candidatus Peribacteria bacterium]